MLLAYIDSALGSMLLQAMAGMILAGIVMGRRILVAPLAWFQGESNSQEPDGELTDSAELSADS